MDHSSISADGQKASPVSAVAEEPIIEQKGGDFRVLIEEQANTAGVKLAKDGRTVLIPQPSGEIQLVCIIASSG